MAHSAPPLPQCLNIVALETRFCSTPSLVVPAPYTFQLTEYPTTSAAELPERVRDADIVIETTTAFTPEVLAEAVTPRLRLILAIASGVDRIDLATCAARGIRVFNTPNCNASAVAEHAVGLYFSVRRSLMPLMRGIRAGDWIAQGTLMDTIKDTTGKPPRSCAQETAVVVGYGAVGQRVTRLLLGLGFSEVLVSGRKGVAAADVPEGRVAFADALKVATVLVLCCPLSSETRNLLSTEEFEAMRSDAVLVNVSRGGVVDEAALLVALQKKQITGAAADVYTVEPAGPETSPLLGSGSESLNLVTTPHSAWIGTDTITNYHRAMQENLTGFFTGDLVKERVKA